MIRKILAAAALMALTTSVSTPEIGAQQPGEMGYEDVSVMPDGVVGDRIQSMIATFNSGDPERVRVFFEEEVGTRFRGFAPMEEHQAVFAETLRQWGPVEFHSIRKYTPAREDGEVVVILRDTNFDAWRAFSLRIDDGEEDRIAMLGFNDARTPSNVDDPPLTRDSFLAEADRSIRKACELDVFSGTVLVAHGTEILLSHSCGEASKRFHVPNNIDTRFNLGSMNKMFTSVAIMQLVEKGVLYLEDPISEYLDESWLPREMTDKITIHHLLSHTSGLGSYFNDTYWESSRMLYRALDDYKALVNGEELAFEPGERFRYSNTGMFLLGVVIESATGDSYFDYIRENIYAPAGMTDSDSYDMDQPVENLAIGYDRAADNEWGWENNLYKHVIRGGPAGGGFSTVGDLHRFALALISGQLVSETSLETMWTPQSDDTYGYGFSIEEGANGKVVGHGGGFPGLNANLDIMLDRGYHVAVMANYGGAASPVASQIAALMARVPPRG